MNWDQPTEDPIWDEPDDMQQYMARKRQDEEDLAQSRAEDYELGWYH